MKCKTQGCKREAQDELYCYVCEDEMLEAQRDAQAERDELEEMQNGS